MKKLKKSKNQYPCFARSIFFLNNTLGLMKQFKIQIKTHPIPNLSRRNLTHNANKSWASDSSCFQDVIVKMATSAWVVTAIREKVSVLALKKTRIAQLMPTATLPLLRGAEGLLSPMAHLWSLHHMLVIKRMWSPMLTQYIKFIANGAALGLIALMLHAGIFRLGGESDAAAYAIASLITYIPLIAVNFLIQKSMIFSKMMIFDKFH